MSIPNICNKIKVKQLIGKHIELEIKCAESCIPKPDTQKGAMLYYYHHQHNTLIIKHLKIKSI